MRRLITLAIAITFALILSPPSVAQLAQVDALVQRFMGEEKVVGIAVAVMQGDRIVHAGGYGYADPENGVKATETTVFRIASLTKQFTATALLMLEKQGKLSLDDDLAKHLPEFASLGRRVTVAQLLDHTSGINFDGAFRRAAQSADPRVDAQRDLSPAALRRLFAETTFEFDPGTRFRYNNSAYQLAGLLIERLSGLSYATFIERHIFEPLGMKQSYYLDTHRLIEHRANGHTFRDGAVVNAPAIDMNWPYAAGSLGSTVLDLMKWQRALLSNRLFGAEVFARMTTAAKLSGGESAPYGLGFFLTRVDGQRRIGHYGSIDGFRAQLAHYPQANLTIAVLANTNPARTEVLESRIARALLGIREVDAAEIELSTDQLRQYAGRYVVKDAPISRRSNVTEITLRDGALYADRFRLRPIGRDEFVPMGDPYHRYIFGRRDGEVAALRVEREGELMVDATRE